MANLCSNCVIFSGDETALANVKELFQEIQDQQEATGKWYLPEYVTAAFSHMQDITIHENSINYETRWSPNLQGLVQIANHFNLDFKSYYDEMSNGVFGEATYIKGSLLDVCLDPEDLQGYHFDAANQTYNYKGETYENETPIFERILEEKKAGNHYFKTTNNISKEELNQLYGEMTDADLVLKFAEHKNFEKARAAFLNLDNDTLNAIDAYITETRDFDREQFSTNDKYIAMTFLKVLVKEWNHRPPSFGLHR